MKGVANKSELLVTDAERTTKLLEVLGSRFSHHGELLLPTYRQYEALDSNDGLLALAKDIFRWMGYKPRKLTITYGSVHRYEIIDHDVITISSAFKDHPLVAGGLVALATVDFAAQHHHMIGDERFIEMGTIEAGLGLWIINGLQPKRSRSEKLYHMLDGNWLQLEGLQLQSTSIPEYIRQFSIFTGQNHLFLEDYASGVSKRALHLLPEVVSGERLLPMVEPTATLKHLNSAKLLWIKLSLVCAIVAAIGIFAIVIWAQRPQATPYEQTRDTETLRVIKNSLNDCIGQAAKQQDTYDPNDLFMTRQIDATKVRCESLRNQYNEALSNYQTNYLNKR